MVPQCVVHLQMGWTGKLKMYLYSLPSVLAAFHWYKSAWSALVCSRQGGGLGGSWEMWSILLSGAARGCWDLPSQHVLQVKSLSAHFC